MPSSSHTRYVPSACRFHTLKYAPLRSISFESWFSTTYGPVSQPSVPSSDI